MIDDTENISRKTWTRNLESVNKIGYMDGAADGQAAVFQSSFDMGYKQGFSFGLQLGFSNATISLNHEDNEHQSVIRDPRRINCQLCLTGIPSEQNIVNLYNTQQESNSKIIKQKPVIEND